MRCAACDFEFVWPIPPPEVTEAVYADSYFTGDGHGYGDYFARERRANLRKAEARLERLATLGVGRGARLLDIGCADGTVVREGVRRGLDARGVEVSAEALAAMAPEIRARTVSSIAEATRTGAFDAVTFFDVLEHLPTFLEVLRQARDAVRSGGIVGVVVPVIDNVNARLLPWTWDQYKPPEHLWYFSTRSLRALLEQEVGRVEVEEVAWRRDARWLGVARPTHTRLGGLARRIEELSVRTLLAGHVIPRRAVVDSVAMWARIPHA